MEGIERAERDEIAKIWINLQISNASISFPYIASLHRQGEFFPASLVLFCSILIDTTILH